MYGGGRNKGRKLDRYVTGGGGGDCGVEERDGGLSKMGSMGGGKDCASGSRSEKVFE